MAGPADPLAELLARVGQVARDSQGLLQQLAGSERRYRALAKAVWQVQEEERRRLSRELHDGLGQDLTALKNQLELLVREARRAEAEGAAGGGGEAGGGEAGDAQPAGVQAGSVQAGGVQAGSVQAGGAPAGSLQAGSLADRLAGAVELAARALHDTRELSRLLRPPILDDLGLVAALGWLGRRLRETAGFEVRFTCEGLEGPPAQEPRLPPDLEILIFRVAQEALTNALKHSGAKAASLTLVRRDSWLELKIADAGRGFDPQRAFDPELGAAGSGLRGMRDRLDLYGGRLRILSTPGEGTRVTAMVPVERAVSAEVAEAEAAGAAGAEPMAGPGPMAPERGR